MLRIAVPNKGSLAEPSAVMLREAGYRQRSESRELVLRDPDNAVEFFFLRPRDIAVYVGSGTVAVGITGRDLLLDSGSPAEEVLALGYGTSTFRYATVAGTAREVRDLEGRRIATSFPGLVAKHLAELGVSAEVIRLDGAVETSVRLGVADVIADVVETGTTLRQAGLELIGDPILHSEAVLIRRCDGQRPADAGPAGRETAGGETADGEAADGETADGEAADGETADGEAAGAGAGVDQLVRRLRGVLVARRHVMMDYDVPVEQVDTAVALTPGIESPTVSPLRDPGWVAVRAMVPRADAQRIMDDLWEVGARAILVTDIHACRL